MTNEKQHILFIINPISGVGKKNVIPPLIEKHLDQTKFSYQIEYTKHRGHGAEIADENKSKFDIIVAVGGDGSVNEIGGALVGSSCSLAIIPVGSGNGLARHAGIPLKIDKAIKHINSSTPKLIDTGLINGRKFLGTCGIGIDAYIAKKFDEHHKRGFASYTKLVLRELKNYLPPVYHILSEEESIQSKAMICSIANASEFGNGFKISPLSELNDGQMELILIDKIKMVELPTFAWRFFGKRIHRSSKFKSIIFRNKIEISVSEGREVDYHADGEPLGKSSKFEVLIEPNSLKLI